MEILFIGVESIFFFFGSHKMNSMMEENKILYLFLEEIIHQFIVVFSFVIDYIHKEE